MTGHTISCDDFVIVVDKWDASYMRRPASLPHYFFLTHLHADHIKGLTSTWSRLIYTSPFNAWLLPVRRSVKPALLKELEIGVTHTIKKPKEGTAFQVTPLDANHCPGAVMFLFQGPFGNVLFTGDFRYKPGILDNPAMSSIIRNKELNKLYLDNTYAASNCTFPSREDALTEILKIVDDHPEYKIIVGLRQLGKEEVLKAIALHINERVCVSPQRLEILSKLGYEDVFTTDPSESRVHAVELHSITQRHAQESAKVIAIKLTAIYSCAGVAPVEKKRGNVFVVPYSDHSSHSELVQFLTEASPHELYPVVEAKLSNANADTPWNKMSSVNCVIPEVMWKLCGTAALPQPPQSPQANKQPLQIKFQLSPKMKDNPRKSNVIDHIEEGLNLLPLGLDGNGPHLIHNNKARKHIKASWTRLAPKILAQKGIAFKQSSPASTQKVQEENVCNGSVQSEVVVKSMKRILDSEFRPPPLSIPNLPILDCEEDGSVITLPLSDGEEDDIDSELKDMPSSARDLQERMRSALESNANGGIIKDCTVSIDRESIRDVKIEIKPRVSPRRTKSPGKDGTSASDVVVVEERPRRVTRSSGTDDIDASSDMIAVKKPKAISPVAWREPVDRVQTRSSLRDDESTSGSPKQRTSSRNSLSKKSNSLESLNKKSFSTESMNKLPVNNPKSPGALGRRSNSKESLTKQSRKSNSLESLNKKFVSTENVNKLPVNNEKSPRALGTRSNSKETLAKQPVRQSTNKAMNKGSPDNVEKPAEPKKLVKAVPPSKELVNSVSSSQSKSSDRIPKKTDKVAAVEDVSVDLFASMENESVSDATLSKTSDSKDSVKKVESTEKSALRPAAIHNKVSVLQSSESPLLNGIHVNVPGRKRLSASCDWEVAQEIVRKETEQALKALETLKEMKGFKTRKANSKPAFTLVRRLSADNPPKPTSSPISMTGGLKMRSRTKTILGSMASNFEKGSKGSPVPSATVSDSGSVSKEETSKVVKTVRTETNNTDKVAIVKESKSKVNLKPPTASNDRSTKKFSSKASDVSLIQDTNVMKMPNNPNSKKSCDKSDPNITNVTRDESSRTKIRNMDEVAIVNVNKSEVNFKPPAVNSDKSTKKPAKVAGLSVSLEANEMPNNHISKKPSNKSDGSVTCEESSEQLSNKDNNPGLGSEDKFPSFSPNSKSTKSPKEVNTKSPKEVNKPAIENETHSKEWREISDIPPNHVTIDSIVASSEALENVPNGVDSNHSESRSNSEKDGGSVQQDDQGVFLTNRNLATRRDSTNKRDGLNVGLMRLKVDFAMNSIKKARRLSLPNRLNADELPSRSAPLQTKAKVQAWKNKITLTLTKSPPRRNKFKVPSRLRYGDRVVRNDLNSSVPEGYSADVESASESTLKLESENSRLFEENPGYSADVESVCDGSQESKQSSLRLHGNPSEPKEDQPHNNTPNGSVDTSTCTSTRTSTSEPADKGQAEEVRRSSRLQKEDSSNPVVKAEPGTRALLKQSAKNDNESGKGKSVVNPGNGKEKNAMNPGNGKDKNAMNPGNGKEKNAMNPGNGKEKTAMNPGNGKEKTAMNPGNGKEKNAMNPGNGKEGNATNPGNGKEENAMNPGNGKEKSGEASKSSVGGVEATEENLSVGSLGGRSSRRLTDKAKVQMDKKADEILHEKSVNILTLMADAFKKTTPIDKTSHTASILNSMADNFSKLDKGAQVSPSLSIQLVPSKSSAGNLPTSRGNADWSIEIVPIEDITGAQTQGKSNPNTPKTDNPKTPESLSIKLMTSDTADSDTRKQPSPPSLSITLDTSETSRGPSRKSSNTNLSMPGSSQGSNKMSPGATSWTQKRQGHHVMDTPSGRPMVQSPPEAVWRENRSKRPGENVIDISIETEDEQPHGRVQCTCGKGRGVGSPAAWTLDDDTDSLYEVPVTQQEMDTAGAMVAFDKDWIEACFENQIDREEFMTSYNGFFQTIKPRTKSSKSSKSSKGKAAPQKEPRVQPRASTSAQAALRAFQGNLSPRFPSGLPPGLQPVASTSTSSLQRSPQPLQQTHPRSPKKSLVEQARREEVDEQKEQLVPKKGKQPEKRSSTDSERSISLLKEIEKKIRAYNDQKARRSSSEKGPSRQSSRRSSSASSSSQATGGKPKQQAAYQAKKRTSLESVKSASSTEPKRISLDSIKSESSSKKIVQPSKKRRRDLSTSPGASDTSESKRRRTEVEKLSDSGKMPISKSSRYRLSVRRSLDHLLTRQKLRSEKRTTVLNAKRN